MPPSPEASVIVPTKGRPAYLRAALESLARQDVDPDSYEVIVIDDGPSQVTRNVAEQVASQTGSQIAYAERQGVPGLNAARNTGIAAARSQLIVFVDDDIEAPSDWLSELVAGAHRHPGAHAYGGPIELRLEGSRLSMCGREKPPITTLDGGAIDREIDLVWGANMAIDRRALELAGEFDAGVPYGFDEDMWERRLRKAGGKVFYIARAGLVHRRNKRDAKLGALVRESYRRGRSLRAYSQYRGDPPSLAAELRVLGGCVFHTLRYRCGNGILLAAHSAGRVRGTLSHGIGN